MNRNVLCLQVGVVLVVAVWLGTTSPQELLPAPASATPFQVGIDQVSQSGGCLTHFPQHVLHWAHQVPHAVAVTVRQTVAKRMSLKHLLIDTSLCILSERSAMAGRDIKELSLRFQ